MSEPTTDFFDYYCDGCDAPFCERVHLMNLALGHIDEEFCLDCLSNEVSRTPAAMAAYCYRYVAARDCFLDPWNKADITDCPKQASQTCHCAQPVTTGGALS